MKRVALYIFVGSVAVSALLAVYALLSGSFGDLEAKLLVTALCVSGGSITAMACFPAMERKRLGYAPRIGIVAAAIGYGVFILMMWAESEAEELAKFAATAVCAGTAIGYCSLLSLVQLAHRYRWILAFGFACAGALACLLTVLIWNDFDELDTLWRWIGVVSVLLCAATVIAPIFHRLSRSESGDAPVDFEPMLRFCPHCGAAATPKAEETTTCRQCAVRYSVHFDVSDKRREHLHGVFE